MVSSRRAGRLASYAILASSVPGALAATDAATYENHTSEAAEALQDWYESDSGCYSTAGWWNCANCLTVLADWAVVDGAGAGKLGVAGILSNSFANAGKSSSKSKRWSTDAAGAGKRTSPPPSRIQRQQATRVQKRAVNPSQYADGYYDDNGWWTLAWIRAYDLTKDTDAAAAADYLAAAQGLFDIMAGGVDDTCGGGIWWSTDRGYKNAIANELYLSVAASLANRVPGNSTYLDTATAQWSWFKSSGMINAQNLINDGLTMNSDGSCVNNGENTWSYNQGVILGGLVELSRATADDSLLDEAATIAKAAITSLSNATSAIIHESGGCDQNTPDSCGGDGTQFKGIFVRNLGYLHQAAPDAAYSAAILANADSIWTANRDPANDELGDNWAEYDGEPDASTQSSAMDVLVAAIQAAGSAAGSSGYCFVPVVVVVVFVVFLSIVSVFITVNVNASKHRPLTTVSKQQRR